MSPETQALIMLAAGFLPALSSDGAWIRNLSIAAAIVIGFSYLSCAHDSWANLACVLAAPAAAILATASLCFALVRRRERLQGATGVLARPWVAGPLIYGVAAVLVFLAFGAMTGGF